MVFQKVYTMLMYMLTICVFPLASVFPIMDYIPNLSFVNIPKPALVLGAEALSPVIVKRLEYTYIMCFTIIVTHVLNVTFICWTYFTCSQGGSSN